MHKQCVYWPSGRAINVQDQRSLYEMTQKKKGIMHKQLQNHVFFIKKNEEKTIQNCESSEFGQLD